MEQLRRLQSDRIRHCNCWRRNDTGLEEMVRLILIGNWTMMEYWGVIGTRRC